LAEPPLGEATGASLLWADMQRVSSCGFA
jgi:hypothetical protein